MDGKILPAQLKLHKAIIQGWIIDVQGRLGPPGSKERIEKLLSDPEFMLLVTPHGALTVHPPHRRQEFEAKYGVDLDNWWREIDFDRDEGERAVALSLAPCQRPPDRPHLHLVSGARSGETAAPAAPAANAEDQGEAAATIAETAGRSPASTPAGDASAPVANTEVPVAEPEPAARAKESRPEPAPPVKPESTPPATKPSQLLQAQRQRGGRPTDRDMVLEEAAWRVRNQKTEAKTLAAFARKLREWLQVHGEHRSHGGVMKPETIEDHVRPLWNKRGGKTVR
jgi:hypothetical protein